jgi:hypothetical protein
MRGTGTGIAGDTNGEFPREDICGGDTDVKCVVVLIESARLRESRNFQEAK